MFHKRFRSEDANALRALSRACSSSRAIKNPPGPWLQNNALPLPLYLGLPRHHGRSSRRVPHRPGALFSEKRAERLRFILVSEGSLHLTAELKQHRLEAVLVLAGGFRHCGSDVGFRLRTVAHEMTVLRAIETSTTLA